MANITALKNEIDSDPLTRGYAGMTDAQVAADLNTVYRTRNRTSMSGDEIFNSFDATEYNALTQDQKRDLLTLCARDTIDPFGTANVNVITENFGGGSTTAATLNTLRVENVSRADELNLGSITASHVSHARAI
jgi:hypothetical protein